MPTISVIVPVYKVEPFLRRCVDSILNQTFRDFELILVDDGSPDNCGAICDEYAARDSRVCVIHQKNGGLSAARNAGIDWAFANSNSQWLTFIDSDDWVHPELLERLFFAAEENGVSVSVCGYAETAGETPKQCEMPLEAELWNPETFFVEHMLNAILAWGKLYRRTCFQQIRYPAGKIHEDEFITHQLVFPEAKIAVVPVPLYYYFCNPDGITKSKWKPKRMDAIEAIMDQTLYFRTKGFCKAYQKAAEKLAYAISDQMAEMEQSLQSKEETERYGSILKQYARKALWRFWDAYSVDSMPWMYYYAYPKLFALYVRIKGKHEKIS